MNIGYTDINNTPKKFIVHLEDESGNCCKFNIKASCFTEAKKQGFKLKKEMGAKDYLVERKDWSY